MNKYSEIIKKIINKFNFKIEHKNSWYKRNEHSIAEISEDELKNNKTNIQLFNEHTSKSLGYHTIYKTYFQK